MRITSVLAAACALLFLLPSAPAQAQATRTWISGVGDDVNPCSRTAPCKTFPGAISKTAAKGEISVLDPGPYGTVTITKSISLVVVGKEGSILSTGTTGIVINAAATDTVIISGVLIEGAQTGLRGIRVLSAKAVHIRDCLIRNFNGSPGTGIEIAPPAADVQVFISNCTIEDVQNGIVATPTGTGSTSVVLDRVRISKVPAGGAALTANAESIIRVSRSSITNTASAFTTSGNGSIISFQNNAVAGNAAGETPPATALLK